MSGTDWQRCLKWLLVCVASSGASPGNRQEVLGSVQDVSDDVRWIRLGSTHTVPLVFGL